MYEYKYFFLKLILPSEIVFKGFNALRLRSAILFVLKVRLHFLILFSACFSDLGLTDKCITLDYFEEFKEEMIKHVFFLSFQCCN